MYIKKRLSFDETKLRHYNAIIKPTILYVVECLNLSSVEKIQETPKSRRVQLQATSPSDLRTAFRKVLNFRLKTVDLQSLKL